MTVNGKTEKKRLYDAALADPVYRKGQRRTRVFCGVSVFYLISFFIFKTLVHIFYTMKSINIEVSDIVTVVLALLAAALLLSGYRFAALFPAAYGGYVIYHLFDKYANGMPDGHIVLILIPVCQMVLALILLSQVYLLLAPAVKHYATEQRRVFREVRTFERKQKEQQG